MPKYESQLKIINPTITEYWVIEDENPETKRLAFKVDKQNHRIQFLRDLIGYLKIFQTMAILSKAFSTILTRN